MRIPFRELAVRDAGLRSELLDAVDAVLAHGRLILGPEVGRFEDAIARRCGRRFAVGVNSGTGALILAHRALGVGDGDEVITSPLSWVATVNAIVLAGATPVFVDVCEDLTIDADRVEDVITSRTKALLPVHFAGQLSDVARLAEIAERRGLLLIEDGAQAFGARHRGRPCGSFGTIGCFSMNPMKMLNAFGEAGAIVTDDEDVRGRLLALRYAGTVEKEDCRFPSGNERIDTVQAAMLLVSLAGFDEKVERRRAIARAYDERLAGVVACPQVRPGNEHTYYAYTITCERRDDLQAHLASKGIETKVQHPILMPYHSAYRGRFSPRHSGGRAPRRAYSFRSLSRRI